MWFPLLQPWPCSLCILPWPRPLSGAPTPTPGPPGAWRPPSPGAQPGCGGAGSAPRRERPLALRPHPRGPGPEAGGRSEPFPGRYFGPLCELRGAGRPALCWLFLLIMGARCMEIINSSRACATCGHSGPRALCAECEPGPAAQGSRHPRPVPGAAALPASPGRSWGQSLFLCGPRGNSVRPPNTHGPHHVLLQPLPCGPARLDRQLCSHLWFGGTRRAGLVESARRALHLRPSGRTALAPGWGAVTVLPVEGPLLGGKGQARAGVGEAQAPVPGSVTELAALVHPPSASSVHSATPPGQSPCGPVPSLMPHPATPQPGSPPAPPHLPPAPLPEPGLSAGRLLDSRPLGLCPP